MKLKEIMRKSHFRWFVVSICLLLTTVSALAQREFYVMGSDGNWNTNIASAVLYETAEGSNIYENEVEFLHPWFYFVEQLTEEANDWESYVKYTYGPEKDSDPLCVNGCADLHNPARGAFKIDKLGKYKVTVDMNTKTACIREGIRKFYVIGNISGYNEGFYNESAVLYETAEGSNIYENEVEFKYHWVYFAEQLMEETVSGDSFKKHTYGPKKDGDPLRRNRCAGLFNPTVGAFKIDELGKYKVTVDMNTKSVFVGDEDFTRPSTPGPGMYIVGTENAWCLGAPQATLAQTEEEDVYSGIVSFKGISEFKIMQIKESSTVSYGTSNGVVTDVVGNENIISQDGSDIPVFKGTYEMTVDMKRLRLKMKLLDEQREMYIVGNDGVWDCNKAGAVLKETGYNSNVYVANNVNFSSNVFILIELLSSDWNVATSYKYRYVDDPNVTLKEVKNLKQDSEGWFQIESGTYDVIVDMNNMTMLVAPVGWVVPNMMYMVGSSNDYNINEPIATLYEDADNKGVYHGEITFDDTTQFKFLTVLGSWEDNYGISGTGISLNTPIPICENGNMFELPAGKYSITLDLINSCVYFYENTSTSVEGFRVNTEGNEKVFDFSGVQYVRVNGKRIVIINGKKIVK